ncbi:hypothetical protein H310_00973, partial [Aphanomyces invadans]
MLRQLYNIVFTGGFTRVSNVHARLAEKFSVPAVDQLMLDGVIRPKNTSRAMCILTTACVPDTPIDLRDFQSGAKHALQHTLAHVFSPAMVDFAVNQSDEAVTADTYLQDTCTSRLHPKLIAFCANIAKKNEGLVTPGPIHELAIVDGEFNVDVDDNSEYVALTVACNLPYKNEPYEKEGNTVELEQRIVAASDAADSASGVTVEGPKQDDQASTATPGGGTPVDAATDATGKLFVFATFRSDAGGDLDWRLQDLRITGVKPLQQKA